LVYGRLAEFVLAQLSGAHDAQPIPTEGKEGARATSAATSIFRRWRLTLRGRIVNRERPVVVVFAIHKVAAERQNVRESDFELDLFATQSRSDWQDGDLAKRPF
jgi:anaerobic glycerol-3-phosphate dehydrogenase